MHIRPYIRSRLHWCVRALATLALFSYSLAATAFSQGAPICEVNSLPLREMSEVLASPAPTGWTLEVEPSAYVSGMPVIIRVRNVDPLKRALGVLLWAKLGPGQGAGEFELPAGGQFQFIPAPANCGLWAVTHTDSLPKDESDMMFFWHPPESGSVIMRAFVIEECTAVTDCRSHQALTPILSISQSPVLFADGFES